MEEEIKYFPEEVYEGLGDKESLLAYPDHVFVSSTWVKHFHKFTSKEWLEKTDAGTKTRVHHGIRMIVMYGTISAFDRGEYVIEDGKTVRMDSELIRMNVLKTALYKEPPTVQIAQTFNTVIEVVEGDCLEVAHFIQQQGYSTFCLNMANAHSPGGGYMHGAGAQEENLHRRTGLFQCLRDPKKIQGKTGGSANYPIPEEGVIYSPDVIVIRDCEAKGYKFLETPYFMSFISCAAINKPRLRPGNEKMEEGPTEVMKEKIRSMLGTGLKNGHDAAVLCALGCGAFRCPVHHVARLFKKIIEREFNGAYKKIVFAIYNDHNARGEGNVKPFATTFNVVSQPFETYSKNPLDAK